MGDRIGGRTLSTTDDVPRFQTRRGELNDVPGRKLSRIANHDGQIHDRSMGRMPLQDLIPEEEVDDRDDDFSFLGSSFFRRDENVRGMESRQDATVASESKHSGLMPWDRSSKASFHSSEDTARARAEDRGTKRSSSTTPDHEDDLFLSTLDVRSHPTGDVFPNTSAEVD